MIHGSQMVFFTLQYFPCTHFWTVHPQLCSFYLHTLFFQNWWLKVTLSAFCAFQSSGIYIKLCRNALYCQWFQCCSMICFYADNAKLSALRTSRCNPNLWKLFNICSENVIHLICELCSFSYFIVFQLMSTASVALQRRHTIACDHPRTVHVVISLPWMLNKIHKFTTLSAGDVQTAQSWAALLHTPLPSTVWGTFNQRGSEVPCNILLSPDKIILQLRVWQSIGGLRE